MAGRQVRVKGLAPRACRDPVFVVAFEHVSEGNAASGEKTQTRVAEFQVLLSWRELRDDIGALAFAVDCDFLDHHRRRRNVALQVLWVENDQPPDRGKPYAPVEHSCDRRLDAGLALDHPQRIGRTVGRTVESLDLARGEPPQVGPGHRKNALAASHPQTILVVFGDAVDLIVEQTISREIAEDSFSIEQAQSASHHAHP